MSSGDQDAGYRILWEDASLRNALSGVGVFASDYLTGNNIPSDVWTAQEFSEDEMGANLGWIERLHPEDQDRVRRAASRVFSGETTRFEETFRLRRRNGSYRWVVTRGVTVSSDADGRPLLFVGVDTDISHFKTVEHRLQQQNDELETLRQVAAIIGSSLDFAETVRRILEHTRRIIPYETATVQILEDGFLRIIDGYGFDSIDEVRKLRFPYPEAGSLSTRALDDRRPYLSLDVTVDFPAFVQPSADKLIHSWIGIPLLRHGELIGLMTTDSTRRGAYDVTHLRLAATIADHIAIALENARLHDTTYQMAMTDALTNVGTRRRFQVEGRFLYEAARRKSQTIAAMMIDIDHFKAVNDTFGHAVGDSVLKRVAEACGSDLRGSDLLARYGGEEFVVLLPESGTREAAAAAERMRLRIESITHPEIDDSVTVSIGVACAMEADPESFDAFIQRADEALYQAKAEGRNRVVLNGCPDLPSP